jgi:carbonic anhydrase/acetyltransferase-like protein (isoleucine patch superfamily)
MTIRAFQKQLPTLAENVFIDETALVIGRVTLGADVSVWPMTVMRGDVNNISIGARTNIQDGSVCHVTSPNNTHPNGFSLNVGEDVTVGHKVILHGCTIGSRVLVGMGAIVMDGVVIPDDVMLAAGCLVSPGKVLESGFLYVGSPAKKSRELTENEKAFLIHSAKHYVGLKNKHIES